MSDGGKGSNPRPFSVPQKDFDNSFETIFGKKEPKPRWVPPPLVVEDQKAEDEAFDAIKTTSTILGSETQSQ
jgi:hypothetical protein